MCANPKVGVCPGITGRGEQCRIKVAEPDIYCAWHNPNRPVRPVRPSLANKKPKPEPRPLYRNRPRAVPGYRPLWPSVTLGRKKLIDQDIIINCLESITGVAHISISYPGYDHHRQPYEEARARALGCYTLYKYGGKTYRDIADIYNMTMDACRKNVAKVVRYVKKDKWYSREDYQQMLSDIKFDMGLMRTPKVKKP